MDRKKKQEKEAGVVESTSLSTYVITRDPLYHQIYDSCATDMAVEDAIYALSQGLYHNKVAFDDFFKVII